jgi:hypothetical protein
MKTIFRPHLLATSCLAAGLFVLPAADTFAGTPRCPELDYQQDTRT